MENTNETSNQEIEEIRNYTLQVLVEAYTSSNITELNREETLAKYGIYISQDNGWFKIKDKAPITFYELGIRSFFNQLQDKSKQNLLKINRQSKSVGKGRYRNIENEAEGNEFDELFHKMFYQEERLKQERLKARGIDYDKYKEVFGLEKFKEFKHRFEESLRNPIEEESTLDEAINKEGNFVETPENEKEKFRLKELENLRLEVEEQELDEDLEL